MTPASRRCDEAVKAADADGPHCMPARCHSPGLDTLPRLIPGAAASMNRSAGGWLEDWQMFVSIEGVLNARDFGGKPGAGGRTVRPGRLLRTAHLAEVTDAGRATLQALEVATVVDLRRAVERNLQPNRLDGLPVTVIQSDLSERADDGAYLPPHMQYLLEAELTPQGTHDWMVSSYSEFPWYPQHQETFAAAFQALAVSEGALVVHCAAGKDRTGILCGLILHALGVDDAVIEHDYLLTNQQPGFDRRTREFAERFEERLGRRIAHEALEPMVGVHRDFLQAAWSAIDARHGSRLAYLGSLGIDDAMLEAIRSRLLIA